MPIELGVWRLEAAGPRRLAPSPLANEARLEEIIEHDPTILGLGPLLVVGRQVLTAYGKYIDLLALDAEGNVVVVELKRDRTPRDVIAQALDYGSWVVDLGYEEIIEIRSSYAPSGDLSDAYTETFGQPLPDELNASHQLVVVASELDSSTERIVSYLERLSVPVNAVFFRYLKDGEHEYLMRSWLRDPGEVEARARVEPASKPHGTTRTSTSRSVRASTAIGVTRCATGSFREARGSGEVVQPDAQEPSAREAGLRLHPAIRLCRRGDRGRRAVPVRDFTVQLNGTVLPILEAPHDAPEMDVNKDSDELSEWLVRVEGLKTVPREGAFREKRLFANQATACRLRDQRTIDRVTQAFGLQDS